MTRIDLVAVCGCRTVRSERHRQQAGALLAYSRCSCLMSHELLLMSHEPLQPCICRSIVGLLSSADETICFSFSPALTTCSAVPMRHLLLNRHCPDSLLSSADETICFSINTALIACLLQAHITNFHVSKSHPQYDQINDRIQG